MFFKNNLGGLSDFDIYNRLIYNMLLNPSLIYILLLSTI